MWQLRSIATKKPPDVEQVVLCFKYNRPYQGSSHSTYLLLSYSVLLLPLIRYVTL